MPRKPVFCISLVMLFSVTVVLHAQVDSLLWRSVTLGNQIVGNGVALVTVDDGAWQTAYLGGAYCIRMKPNNLSQSAYLYFAVDDDYIYNDALDVFVTVEYFDRGTGSFLLQFDDGNNPYISAGMEFLTNSDQWKKHTFVLPKVGLTNQQNGGADFRLVVSDTALALLAVKSISVWRAPGQFIAPKHSDFTGESFASDDDLLFTYYFYWYDIYSGAHIWDDPDQTDDALQDHPYTMEDFSFKSVAWHKKELLDMMDAGIDVALPVYWGAARMMERWSVEGLINLVRAEQELIAEGKTPPKIGLFFDTSTLKGGEYVLKSADGATDLASPFGKAFFFKHIRDFYSLIPPALWARIDGRPVVWLYAAAFARNANQSLITYVNTHFAEAFDGMTPYIVREVSWNLNTQNDYAWGAALSGAQIQGVASVGPGYNDSAVPGRTTPIREREDGDFYRRNWSKVLASGRNFVVVETWNEFHEGTDICNSREYGRAYIDMTAEFAGKLKQPVKFLSFQPQGWTRELHPTCLVMVQDKKAGIDPASLAFSYSGDGGATWNSWSASCTGTAGTREPQIITAKNVPFTQSARPLTTPNYVRFSMTNSEGVTVTSVPFPVFNGTPPDFVATIDLGEQSEGNGIRQRFHRNDDGWTGTATVGGQSCVYNLVQNSSPYPGRYLYFDVEDSLVYAGSDEEVWLTIEYYDTSATERVELQYDSPGTSLQSRYKSGGSISVGNSRKWKTRTFHLTDPYFANRENGGSDFRLATSGVLFLNRVTVTNTQATGVQGGKTGNSAPADFGLQQNYPNPFNQSTKIRYQLAKNSRVNLTIYDINGRVVRTLVNARQAAGTYECTWNGRSDDAPATTGIYFAVLKTRDEKDVRRILLLR